MPPQPSEPFRFKQFSVQHGPGLKVTTDAVFMGGWAPIATGGPILDVGTGTGLLALMAAQRAPEAGLIVGIEPQDAAYHLAVKNAEASPWQERIAIVKTTLEAFTPTFLFGTIFCNPPFFINSLPRQDAALAMATHADADLLPRWLGLLAPMLAPEGVLTLMAQPQDRLAMLKLAHSLGLFMVQEAFLHHSPRHTALRWLACFSLINGPVPRRPNWYIKDAAGQPDAAHAELVRAFYL